MGKSRPKNAMPKPHLGFEHVRAAIGDLRTGAEAEDDAAAAMLELVALGARQQDLALLTTASIEWPSSATFRALPRPDIAILLQGKCRRHARMPLRGSPDAACWIAKRARATPAPTRLFSEAMSRRAM